MLWSALVQEASGARYVVIADRPSILIPKSAHVVSMAEVVSGFASFGRVGAWR